ncbi:MAG: hypothetical protein PHY28_03380 [Dehalococcoidales bacterium]|nr:hypothetical protein [Dehalococcoidales bacterium]
MGTSVSYVVNCGFAWFIVLLAIVGYFLTLRRMGEKWLFWIVLAVGWGFFAMANTLLAVGVAAGTPVLIAIWLSSYVLVVMSMALLFVKLIKVKQP